MDIELFKSNIEECFKKHPEYYHVPDSDELVFFSYKDITFEDIDNAMAFLVSHSEIRSIDFSGDYVNDVRILHIAEGFMGSPICTKFIKISIARYSYLSLVYNDYDNSVDVKGQYKRTCAKILIFDDDTILCDDVNMKRLRPASVKDIMNFDIFSNDILRCLSAKTKNSLWGCFVDNYAPPYFTTDEISKSHDIIQLLENKFNTNLPWSTTAKNLNWLYACCCAMPYVCEKQQMQLFNINISDFSWNLHRHFSRKRVGALAICRYIFLQEFHNANGIKEEFVYEGITETACDNKTIIMQYIFLSLKYRRKIDLNLNIELITDLHRQYIARYNRSHH